MAADFNPNKWR